MITIYNDNTKLVFKHKICIEEHVSEDKLV